MSYLCVALLVAVTVVEHHPALGRVDLTVLPRVDAETAIAAVVVAPVGVALLVAPIVPLLLRAPQPPALLVFGVDIHRRHLVPSVLAVDAAGGRLVVDVAVLAAVLLGAIAVVVTHPVDALSIHSAGVVLTLISSVKFALKHKNTIFYQPNSKPTCLT